MRGYSVKVKPFSISDPSTRRQYLTVILVLRHYGIIDRNIQLKIIQDIFEMELVILEFSKETAHEDGSHCQWCDAGFFYSLSRVSETNTRMIHHNDTLICSNCKIKPCMETVLYGYTIHGTFDFYERYGHPERYDDQGYLFCAVCFTMVYGNMKKPLAKRYRSEHPQQEGVKLKRERVQLSLY